MHFNQLFKHFNNHVAELIRGTAKLQQTNMSNIHKICHLYFFVPEIGCSRRIGAFSESVCEGDNQLHAADGVGSITYFYF